MCAPAPTAVKGILARSKPENLEYSELMAKPQHIAAPIKITVMPPGVPCSVGNGTAERSDQYDSVSNEVNSTRSSLSN